MKLDLKMQKVDMDELDQNEQLSILLKAEVINSYHACNMMSQESFVELKSILLRVSSTIYALVCAIKTDNDSSKKIIAKQARESIVCLIKVLEMLIEENNINLDEVNKNAH